MGDIAPIELFATEYPDVPFIIPHLGSFADSCRAQRAFIDHWSDIGTSSRTRPACGDSICSRRPSDGPARKVLFGSDGPWLHPAVELSKVRVLGLSPWEESLVLAGNCLRLIRRTRPSVCRVKGASLTASW